MKIIHKIIFLTILLIITILFYGAAKKIDLLEQQIEYMQERTESFFTHVLDKSNVIILSEQINALNEKYSVLEASVRKQAEKVDEMVFSYTTLDEILKQMGNEAQKRYERKVADK